MYIDVLNTYNLCWDVRCIDKISEVIDNTSLIADKTIHKMNNNIIPTSENLEFILYTEILKLMYVLLSSY